MPVEIRRAVESDIPELSRLVAALAAYEESLDSRAHFDWDEIRDAPNWLKLVLNREHHAIWVASLDGRLVGHLWIRLKRQRDGAMPRSIGYISQAFVEESFRGRGLMKPMLEEAYEWLRGKGVSVVTLTVLHRNWIGSSAWYKLGYEDWTHERHLDLTSRKK